MTIQATTLTGTYAIKQPSVFPVGLILNGKTGAITGIPTRVAGKTKVTVELTRSGYSSKLATTIDIMVIQGNDYIGGYTTAMSGKVGENLTAVTPNFLK